MHFDKAINYAEPDAMGNVAEMFNENELKHLGNTLLNWVKGDIQSRQPWMDMNSEWLKLAAQVVEAKSYPWAGASNVKYPLVTLATIQFHARSLPNLINSGSPVKVGVLGGDEEGLKAAKAERIGKHMNYQLMREQTNWLDDTDRLLYILPISGQAHRKIYFSGTLGRAASKLLTPQDFIVNYHAKNFEQARCTEILSLTSNEVKSFENAGTILTVKSTSPSDDTIEQAVNDVKDAITGKDNTQTSTDDIPFTFYEIHYCMDLDGDGYKEPYVFIINAEDGQLLRIQPRWAANAVTFTPDNKILNIKADNYFVHYFFLPNPASATHGMGFGHLLGPINEAANTAINALLDSGHLANVQGGFIAKGAKIRGGTVKFKAGHYQYVNTPGSALKDAIVTLPVKEPSGTLFQLLGMLVQSGERIASISDMMVGETPGQNTPATTSMAVLEQGLKVFTGIFGRVHRTLSREYTRLFEINRDYLDGEAYQVLLDDGVEVEVLQEDYLTENLDIVVASDPTLVTDAQKVLKGQSLLEKAQMGTVNPQYATRVALENEGLTKDEIEEAMSMPEPPPDPEMVKLELEGKRLELETKQAEHDMAMDELRINAEAKKDLADQMLKIAKASEANNNIKIDQFMAMIEAETKKAEEGRANLQAVSDANLKASQSYKLDKEAENATLQPAGGSSGAKGKSTDKS